MAPHYGAAASKPPLIATCCAAAQPVMRIRSLRSPHMLANDALMMQSPLMSRASAAAAPPRPLFHACLRKPMP
jgi:hypothetical protein